MSRDTARKPVSRTDTYLKYGFVAMEHEYHHCPRCNHILNAGPGYQPKYCDQCGQRVTFTGIIWKKDKEIRDLPVDERGGGSYQQKSYRVV